MKRFDFDNSAPDRRNTSSYKWDSIEKEDVIPLWVADMDFKTAPCVIEALRKRVEHGVFGYVKVPVSYYSSLCGWFEAKHGWKISPESVIYTSGVVPAISAIIKALIKPGEGVILQTPAYNCFFSSIRNNGCKVVENPLIREELEDGFTYKIDFQDLRKKALDPNNKLMLLCNPHNPTGRIWTDEELCEIKEICHEGGVVVVSDEIHCELTMPDKEYVPYGTIDPAAVICCSPSKAFNIAGLQIANIIAPIEERRKRIDRAININEVCDVNPFGVVALQAAYNEGGEWLEALREYIYDNYLALRKFFKENLPELKVCHLEATYLAWIDISPLKMKSDEFEEYALKNHGVYVNAGSMYGLDGFIRINMACPRERLLEGLKRLRRGIKELRD